MVCGTGWIGKTGWLDKPFGLVDFGPACETHDGDYGEPLGRSRLDLDIAFLSRMNEICWESARWYKPYWVLSLFAHNYYRVVRGPLGQAAWDKARRNDK